MRTHAEKGGEIIKETFGHIGDGEYEKWHMRLQGIIMKMERKRISAGLNRRANSVMCKDYVGCRCI